MATRGTRATAEVKPVTDTDAEAVPVGAEGYHDAKGRVAPISPEPTPRPYAEAITEEHRDALRAAGLLSS